MKKIELLAAAMLPSSVLAQSYLIENVRIFNGVDPELTAGHVLVEDGVITTISEDAIAAPDEATIIDGGNRVLSPGFIDLHAHGQSARANEYQAMDGVPITADDVVLDGESGPGGRRGQPLRLAFKNS